MIQSFLLCGERRKYYTGISVLSSRSHIKICVYFPREEILYHYNKISYILLAIYSKNCGSFIFEVSLEKLPEMVDYHLCSSFLAQEVLLRGPGHVQLTALLCSNGLVVRRPGLHAYFLKGQEVQAVWVFGAFISQAKDQNP